MKKTKRKTRKPDKYDKAMAYLKKNPGQMINAFMAGYIGGHQASCLFQGTGRDPSDRSLGCLAIVKDRMREGPTPAITRAIRADASLESNVLKLKPKDLKVYAKWQRRIDKELGRK